MMSDMDGVIEEEEIETEDAGLDDKEDEVEQEE